MPFTTASVEGRNVEVFPTIINGTQLRATFIPDIDKSIISLKAAYVIRSDARLDRTYRNIPSTMGGALFSIDLTVVSKAKNDPVFEVGVDMILGNDFLKNYIVGCDHYSGMFFLFDRKSNSPVQEVIANAFKINRHQIKTYALSEESGTLSSKMMIGGKLLQPKITTNQFGLPVIHPDLLKQIEHQSLMPSQKETLPAMSVSFDGDSERMYQVFALRSHAHRNELTIHPRNLGSGSWVYDRVGKKLYLPGYSSLSSGAWLLTQYLLQVPLQYKENSLIFRPDSGSKWNEFLKLKDWKLVSFHEITAEQIIDAFSKHSKESLAQLSKISQLTFSNGDLLLEGQNGQRTIIKMTVPNFEAIPPEK